MSFRQILNMATLMNKPKADLTPEELEEREKHEFQESGQISLDFHENGDL